MRQPQTKKAKEPIALRTRKIANGNESLYLYQYINGKIHRQYLGLFLIPELTPADKIANANTMAIANAMKAQAILEFTTKATGIQTAAARQNSKLLFTDWMETVAESDLTSKARKGEKRSKSYENLVKNTISHVQTYAQQEYGTQNIFIANVDRNFCEGFISYLKTAKQRKRGRTADPNAPRHDERARVRAVALLNKEQRPPVSKSSARCYFQAFARAVRAAKSVKPETNLYTWLDLQADQCKGEASARTMRAAARHLEIYRKGHRTTVADATPEMIEGFRTYFETAQQLPPAPRAKKEKPEASTKEGTPISPKTAYTYFCMFKHALQQAYDKGIIKEMPIGRDDGLPDPETHRDFLTIEELQRLIATECEAIQTKRAFLFSCFCGLRLSDVRTLTWQHLQDEDGYLNLSKIMKKTRKEITTYLSSNARKWLPAPEEAQPDGTIFTLPSTTAIEGALKRWAKRAGINKDISFHVARHTFGTMLVTKGEDLYTVQKLMGHANIQTTQIYAEIVGQKKKAAIDLLESIDTDVTPKATTAGTSARKPRAKKATK